jgi:D-alanine-D-alanine ligase
MAKDGGLEMTTPPALTTLPITKDKRPLIDVLRSKRSTIDCAFLGAGHGEFMEDGGIQGMLDYFKIPYTGSGMRPSTLAMDKYRSMLLVQNIHGVAVPKTRLLRPGPASSQGQAFSVRYSLVVKPNGLGSSVGVHIAKNRKELTAAVNTISSIYPEHPILLQKYIHGAIEVSCGCLEDRHGNFTPLPPIEIVPKRDRFFNYECKYEPGASEEITPPKNLPAGVGAHVSLLACQIHALLGCRTYSRSDFLVKNKTIYYLETNTLPGMTANSLLPKEAAAVGIPFPKLLDFIIENSTVK